MDDHRFDNLSRRLAGLRTRRQAIKAIAGAVVASVAGVSAADAQQCTAHYSPCTGDGQCCSGAVCAYGLCMPGCWIDGSFSSPWAMPPGEVCRQCTPELSTTSWSPANEGMSCWSGDPHAGVTTCQQGVCTGSGPVDCRPLTACHTAAINPQTGQCAQGFAPAGTACGGQAMCHGGFYTPADTCDGNGFCIGGGSRTVSCAPYGCGDGACRTTCDSDSECLAGTLCCEGQCITPDTVDHCGACGNVCAGDECNAPVCTDDGCDLAPINDGVSCGSGFEVCTNGACEAPICSGDFPGIVMCASDDDCDTGEVCQNGGCFVTCTAEFSACNTGCAGTNCRCHGTRDNDALACRDMNYGIGSCYSNADCPAGSVCDKSIFSGARNLCTRPCATQ